jgi:hypothetical protein
VHGASPAAVFTQRALPNHATHRSRSAGPEPAMIRSAARPLSLADPGRRCFILNKSIVSPYSSPNIKVAQFRNQFACVRKTSPRSGLIRTPFAFGLFGRPSLNFLNLSDK